MRLIGLKRLIGLNRQFVQIFRQRFANGHPITIRSEPSRGGQRIIPGARIITAVIYKGYLDDLDDLQALGINGLFLPDFHGCFQSQVRYD